MSKRKNKTTDEKEDNVPKKAKTGEEMNTSETFLASTLRNSTAPEEEPEKLKKKAKKAKTKASAEEIEIPEPFGDPTYDVTFKMLFGDERNKDILISLLNSLLGFGGDKNKEITNVDINSNELPVSFISDIKGQSGISSTIDIVCTTSGKQKIAVEIQRQKEVYLLAREQTYMAQLISGYVKEGKGELYHKEVLETYIIVIGKKNIFTRATKLKDQKLFEIDVVPTVKQTAEIVPDNKMNWKFFELAKFIKSDNYKNDKISKDSDLKEQWLEFLVDCAKQKTEPDRNEIIKKGYDIMKTAKWDSTTKAMYNNQKMAEKNRLETQELELKLARQEEFEKGKLKGEIKGEISKIKSAIEWNVESESIKKSLKLLTDEKVKDNFEKNMDYIKEHLNESDSQIFAGLDLAGLLPVEEHNLETIN